ncbi:hypothetical protein OU995_04945 [Roseateles sp. SL47]|uniref:hypothetical protein n=1 Tax=Roseateles sp. SL47 TaxID=2995138 RepID=UPI00227051C4|nr:hypothetical protein [Roseateles sp. SL47]WAC74080.1 hypothetical protein OU995_04945 [Roseateles sp. SL47]
MLDPVGVQTGSPSTLVVAVLAKLTSKNQLTLPKSVTDSLGPVQYFEVQVQSGQVVLTPVRIQRGDAVRAKLAELDLGDELFAQALAWAVDGPSRSGATLARTGGRKKRVDAKSATAAKASKMAKVGASTGTGESTQKGMVSKANKASKPAKPTLAAKGSKPTPATRTAVATAAGKRSRGTSAQKPQGPVEASAGAPAQAEGTTRRRRAA